MIRPCIAPFDSQYRLYSLWTLMDWAVQVYWRTLLFSQDSHKACCCLCLQYRCTQTKFVWCNSRNVIKPRDIMSPTDLSFCHGTMNGILRYLEISTKILPRQGEMSLKFNTWIWSRFRLHNTNILKPYCFNLVDALALPRRNLGILVPAWRDI